MDVDAILDELIQLSHELGMEERQLAILGEGNLSADCGDGTFWVKASGSNMATIDRSGFTRVRYEVVMDLAALKDPSEEQIFQGLKDSLVEENMRQPSVETFLHAICLQDTEATFIAHTHPLQPGGRQSGVASHLSRTDPGLWHSAGNCTLFRSRVCVGKSDPGFPARI